MNKSELIEIIAKQAEVSKAKARHIIRTVEDALAPAPKKKVGKFKPGKILRDFA